MYDDLIVQIPSRNNKPQMTINVATMKSTYD